MEMCDKCRRTSETAKHITRRHVGVNNSCFNESFVGKRYRFDLCEECAEHVAASIREIMESQIIYPTGKPQKSRAGAGNFVFGLMGALVGTALFLLGRLAAILVVHR